MVWDARSEKILKPVDKNLVEVAWCARQEVPFIVYHGHRTDAEQATMLAKGVSWVRRSKHQDGLAIDVMALDERGKETWAHSYYHKIADAFYKCSEKLGVPITWGCEWRVKDCVHFEVK
jgi:peptidoglycan L-alanyl-D-glutamate endopeptidase CwlK